MAKKHTVDIQKLQNNKQDGYNFQERRHNPWKQTYILYRDRVVTNRITQRQSVNIPLMKQTIKTVLKDVDDMPVMYFENLDNMKDKEVFFNEYWNITSTRNKLKLKDIVDKKQVALFGRSFTQLNIEDGMIKFNIIDPQDILISRYTDPTDIDTSRYLIHQHIFKPLSVIKQNSSYDQNEVEKLVSHFSSRDGLIRASRNSESLNSKNDRMRIMGVDDIDSPILGETYVELNVHYVFEYDEELKEDVIWVYVIAEDDYVLFSSRLEDMIGETDDNYWRTHYPFESWADDVEATDFWTDGIGDVTRNPAETVNTFYAQLVENRTLRNFNMHYYDKTGLGDAQFQPNSFRPKPWGWYGLPGKPKDILQTVQVADLSESLDEINFIINMVERASGATSTQQGVQERRQITLGEIQLALSEAKQMTQSMSKFYTPSWEARAYKFVKMVEAAPDKLSEVKAYKSGKNNAKKIYSRVLRPSDWKSKNGYRVKVWSQDEKESKDADKLQRLSAVRQSMPDNKVMQEIFERKLLEFANLEPEEIQQVLEAQKTIREESLEKTEVQPNSQPGIVSQNSFQQQTQGVI